jgi:hypothetical protein
VKNVSALGQMDHGLRDGLDMWDACKSLLGLSKGIKRRFQRYIVFMNNYIHYTKVILLNPANLGRDCDDGCCQQYFRETSIPPSSKG